MGRLATPTIHDENYEFQIGKGEVLRKGTDVAIIATGLMVAKALDAAEKLKEDGINATVVNIHTIKPLDKELIVNVAKETGKVVTVEEHSVIGGLGSAVCDVLSQEYPTRVKLIGINDVFGQSAAANELLVHYNLTTENIVKTAKSF